MSSTSTPQSVGFARLFWMIVGPGVLLLLAFSIATRGQGWFTPVDIAFLVILPLVLAARWYEFHHGDPHTATGDPATPADLRKYLVVALPLGLAVWALANLLGNHWLAP